MIEGEIAAPYSDTRLDRANDRRADPTWVAGLVEGEIEVLALSDGRCILGSDNLPITLSGDRARAVVRSVDEPMLLGLSGRTALFAVTLDGGHDPDAWSGVGGASLADLRQVVTQLDPVQASRLAYARGLSLWHDQARYCGVCGHRTVAATAGHARKCTGPGCRELQFPRISPAVIVLVESAGLPRRCLLGRHRQSGAGGYSTLAGFLEIGESLECAVRREVEEEAGVRVGAVEYRGSQAWPFPGGVMLAFRAMALDDAVQADGVELIDVRWFTRPELSALAVEGGGRLGRPDSIDRILLEGWLHETE